jgi:hypothetical protein
MAILPRLRFPAGLGHHGALGKAGALDTMGCQTYASQATRRTGDAGMRPLLRTGIAAVLIAGMPWGPAGADMTVYYHAGGWDAFSGPGENGTPVCGVGSTNPADNRSFSLRFQIGGENVTFQAKKPTWRMPAGTLLPVVVQIGLNAPFSMMGAGNGQVVEWSVDSKAIQTFDAQFRQAGSMTVTFPLGDEPPWTVALNGSTAISNAFGRCVTDQTRREASRPQPTAVPDQAATQPFSGLPAQPDAGSTQSEPGSSQPYAPPARPAAPR